MWEWQHKTNRTTKYICMLFWCVYVISKVESVSNSKKKHQKSETLQNHNNSIGQYIEFLYLYWKKLIILSKHWQRESPGKNKKPKQKSLKCIRLACDVRKKINNIYLFIYLFILKNKDTSSANIITKNKKELQNGYLRWFKGSFTQMVELKHVVT